jgi:hypothetical protein
MRVKLYFGNVGLAQGSPFSPTLSRFYNSDLVKQRWVATAAHRPLLTTIPVGEPAFAEENIKKIQKKVTHGLRRMRDELACPLPCKDRAYSYDAA